MREGRVCKILSSYATVAPSGCSGTIDFLTSGCCSDGGGESSVRIFLGGGVVDKSVDGRLHCKKQISIKKLCTRNIVSGYFVFSSMYRGVTPFGQG